MRLAHHHLLLFLLVFFANGCSTVSVNYDYDPTAKFTGLKTFMWLPDPEPVERHTLVLKRVERAAKRELESKGMVLVPDNPDFLVSVHGERESKISVTDWGFSYVTGAAESMYINMKKAQYS